MKKQDCRATKVAVEFGQIKLNQKFIRNGKLWIRTQGIFALPVSQLGQGQSGWPISVREIVSTPTTAQN